MFTAKGFGETKLIGDESTAEGLEKNRRVEFNIIEQTVTEKKVEIDPKSGEKKVLEESTSTINTAPEPEPAPAAEAK
jgi:OOP family OmpA-OmpF porin